MTRNARWAAAIKHKSCRGSKSQDVLACFESRSSRDRIHHNLQHSANDMRACTRVSCNWNWARPAETQPDLLQHHWPSAKTDIQKKQNIRPQSSLALCRCTNTWNHCNYNKHVCYQRLIKFQLRREGSNLSETHVCKYSAIQILPTIWLAEEMRFLHHTTLGNEKRSVKRNLEHITQFEKTKTRINNKSKIPALQRPPGP